MAKSIGTVIFLGCIGGGVHANFNESALLNQAKWDALRDNRGKLSISDPIVEKLAKSRVDDGRWRAEYALWALVKGFTAGMAGVVFVGKPYQFSSEDEIKRLKKFVKDYKIDPSMLDDYLTIWSPAFAKGVEEHVFTYKAISSKHLPKHIPKDPKKITLAIFRPKKFTKLIIEAVEREREIVELSPFFVQLGVQDNRFFELKVFDKYNKKELATLSYDSESPDMFLRNFAPDDILAVKFLKNDVLISAFEELLIKFIESKVNESLRFGVYAEKIRSAPPQEEIENKVAALEPEEAQLIPFEIPMNPLAQVYEFVPKEDLSP